MQLAIKKPEGTMTSMEDIPSVLPFTTCSEKHSIKEASAAIFLSTPIDDPKSFIDFAETNNYINSIFNKKRIIRKRQQAFESSNNTTENQQENLDNKDTIAGFSFVQIDGNEEPLNIFQGINESSTKNYLSFHELKYIRWINFKEKFTDIIESFSSLLENHSVNAIGLTYKDEFVSTNNNPLDYTLLFKNNAKYIPSIIFEEENPDAEISLTLNMKKSGFRFLVTLNIIPTNNDNNFGIQINHTAVHVIDKSAAGTKIAEIKKNSLIKILQASHDLNKDLMKSVLTDEVINMIKLT